MSPAQSPKRSCRNGSVSPTNCLPNGIRLARQRTVVSNAKVTRPFRMPTTEASVVGIRKGRVSFALLTTVLCRANRMPFGRQLVGLTEPFRQDLFGDCAGLILGVHVCAHL